MFYRQRWELAYRMIFVKVWAEYLPVRNQSVRELQIQISKLERMSKVEIFDFLDRFDSMKRAEKMMAKQYLRISSQYKTVLSYVERVYQDVAAYKGAPLTKARLHEELYGAGGFIRQAESYGKQHAPK